MSHQILTANLAKRSTAQEFALGTLYISPLGNHYRYMQADGAVTAYHLYSYIPGTYQIDELIDVSVNPTDGQSVLCCVWDGSATAMADNEYAWVFVGPGSFTGTAAEALDADDIIYGHTTAGQLSDTASVLILNGVTCPAAVSNGATGTFYAAAALWCTDLP